MEGCIRFNNVSKRFRVEKSRPRSWQESLLHLISRKPTVSQEQDFWVLRDVTFEVGRGETVGLIGSNGAGKSTMLKLLTNIVRPTYGTIEINGRISALLELGAGFHHDLTGRENIYLNGAILGLNRQQIDDRLEDIIHFAELKQFIDVPVRNYSSGMFVRLGFAVAVYTDPEILVVDEVLAVGDAAFQRKCMERIYHMRRQGVTIFLVTHSMEVVQKMCQRAIWLHRGQIRADGPVNDVINHYNWYSYEEEAPLTASFVEEAEPQPRQPEPADEVTETETETQGEAAESTEASEPTPEPSPEAPPKRWGSGEIKIEQVRFLDENSQPRNYYRTGETLILELHYCAQEVIERPVFGLAIHNNEGVHITGPNSQFAGCEIGRVEGKGVVRYTITSLPLMEGTYYVSVASHDWEDTKMFDYHDRLYPFRVVPAKGEKYGLVTLRGDWSWQNGNGS